MTTTTHPEDRLPPNHGVDYTKAKFRSSLCRPRLRAHQTVLLGAGDELAYGDLVSAARDGGKEGAQRFADEIHGLSRRRIDSAIARKNGSTVIDHEAEGLTLRSIADMRELRKKLHFDVTVEVPDRRGGTRSITTSAFSLLVSQLAHADATVAAESVPSIADLMVTDLDDVQPNTELAEMLSFPHENPREEPPPLGETEEYREVGVGEDRYTILTYKDGYQRVITQDLLERAPAEAANQIMDLSRGAMEVMEIFQLRRIIDFFGSRGTSPTKHVMILNRQPVSLFSASANTPSPRTPNGTRLVSNPLTNQAALEALRALLATFRGPGKGGAAGYPMPAMFRKLLVPDALWLRAWTLLNSTNTPGVFGEQNFFGPGGPVRPELLSSPFLDLLTNQDFYGGDPERQFVRKFKRRPEVATYGGSDTEAYVRTHTAMRVRIGWDMTVGTRAHVYWAESLATTTPPGGA